METKSGSSPRSSRAVSNRFASPSGVRGGENSTEKVGRSLPAMISSTRIDEGYRGAPGRSGRRRPSRLIPLATVAVDPALAATGDRGAASRETGVPAPPATVRRLARPIPHLSDWRSAARLPRGARHGEIVSVWDPAAMGRSPDGRGPLRAGRRRRGADDRSAGAPQRGRRGDGAGAARGARALRGRRRGPGAGPGRGRGGGALRGGRPE